MRVRAQASLLVVGTFATGQTALPRLEVASSLPVGTFATGQAVNLTVL